MTQRVDDLPLVEPASRDEWGAWLEANYDSARGVWLAVGKKGGSRTTLTYEQAVEEAVRFNWIDSTTRRLDAHRYQQLFTPRKSGSTWAKSNKERVARLEAQGLLTPAAQAAIEAAKADGSWNQLDDVEILVVPDDLAEALAAQPDAARSFEALSESQQKMILHWITSAKRAETRAKRIEATVSSALEGRVPF